ncbi:MAG: PAC2 family protein [Promethearchaeati archaeon SRVP18_Atabeyarchaeia-1]
MEAEDYSTGFKVVTVEGEGAVRNSSDLRKPICIQGMPGVAMCGKAALDYILEELKPKKMYEFYFYDLLPHVKVDELGYMTALKTCAYIWNGKTRDFIFVTGDGQPTNGDGINTFSLFLVERLKNLGVKALVSLAASPVAMINVNPKVYAAATTKRLLNFFVSHGAHVLTEGTIFGMNGVTPSLTDRLCKTPGCILLAEACQALPSDPSASKALIDLLNASFKLEVDSSKLSSAIEKLLEAYGVKAQKRSGAETDYIS